MAKDNTKSDRISVVEDKRTKGLKADLENIADSQRVGVSYLIKKILYDFVKKHKAE
jgi:hypothetical protein